ncbi:MAG: glycosyltransferase [Nocardioides sp.]
MRRSRGSSIFLGPVEISGIIAGLLDGLGRLDIEAHAGLAAPHPFAYAGSQPASRLLRAWQRLGRRRRETPRSRLAAKVGYRTAHQLVAWVVLLRELRRSWAFVFLFGETITNTRLELFLLTRMRKKIVFIYVGSDARPRWMSCVESPASSDAERALLRRSILQQQSRLRRQEAVATACVSARTTTQFLTRPFVDSLVFGLPLPVRDEPVRRASAPRPVRVLHSPSNPRVKGSQHVTDAVAQLKNSGLAIELVCLTGRPHAEVLQAIEECDFVIDQVFSDLPWSGFAAEAATMGRPAVVTGYAAELYAEAVAPDLIPPSVFVLPKDLAEAIRDLAVDEHKRTSLGEAARAFARQRWSSTQVAERLVAILEERPDPDWLVDPQDSVYVYGCGCSLGLVQAQARGLVSAFGESALGVSDKPAYAHPLAELLEMDAGRWGP